MVKPIWKFDKERFPDQRSNWKNLNASQKRYTINAYNAARANRNLPPIPNPLIYPCNFRTM